LVLASFVAFGVLPLPLPYTPCPLVLAAAVLLLMPLVLAIFVTLKVLLPSLHPTRRLRPAALFLSKGSVCSFWRLELEFVLEGLLLLVFLVELSMSIAPTASANVSRLYCCGICCCGLAVEGRVEFEFEIMREILGYGPCNSSSAPARLQFQAPQ
jgi:hypothetical protein